MGHGIIKGLDHVGSTRGGEWHTFGELIERGLSAEEAGKRKNLFWGVDGYPLVAESAEAQKTLEQLAKAIERDDMIAAQSLFALYYGKRIPVDSHVLNVRLSDDSGQPCEYPLGIVGSEYERCQNLELARFMDALASTGQCSIETLGSLRGGRKVWFAARARDYEIQPGDVLHDYLVGSNSHDGSNAIRITPSTDRPVCWNTLHLVIPERDDLWAKPETAAITIRHTGNLADKLEAAKYALKHYQEISYRNRELFEAMAAKRLDREQVTKAFSVMYGSYWVAALPEELTSVDNDVRRLAENRYRRQVEATDSFLARYDAEKTKLGAGDNAWMAFNALSGYLQHDTTARGADDDARIARRVESNLFGLNATRTHEALASIMALCDE
jgi:phage/plasmid-like protein (TIGR03299 family)